MKKLSRFTNRFGPYILTILIFTVVLGMIYVVLDARVDDPAGWVQVFIELALVPVVIFGFWITYTQLKIALERSVIEPVIGDNGPLGQELHFPSSGSSTESNNVSISLANYSDVLVRWWRLKLFIPRELYPRGVNDVNLLWEWEVSPGDCVVLDLISHFMISLSSSGEIPIYPRDWLPLGYFQVPIHIDEDYPEEVRIAYSLDCEKGGQTSGSQPLFIKNLN